MAVLQTKQVAVEQILPLRRDILRPGKTLEQSRFDGDLDPHTFHLALFENEKVLSVASFMANHSDKLPHSRQYQLRGMAVAKDRQGKGLGKILFQKGEDILREKGIEILWFNARSHAVPFYEKAGCTVVGNEFQIPNVGPHFLMIKKL